MHPSDLLCLSDALNCSSACLGFLDSLYAVHAPPHSHFHGLQCKHELTFVGRRLLLHAYAPTTTHCASFPLDPSFAAHTQYAHMHAHEDAHAHVPPAFPMSFYTSAAPGVRPRLSRLAQLSQNIGTIYAPSLVCFPPLHLNPFWAPFSPCTTITQRFRRYTPSYQPQATNMPKRAADADLVQPKGAMNAYMHFATDPNIKERAMIELPTGAAVRIRDRKGRRGQGKESDVEGRRGRDGFGRRVIPHLSHALFLLFPQS